MAQDATGDWNQPGFLDSGAPDIAVDPTVVSNYYAPLVDRRFATAALLLASTPPGAHYTAKAENVPGAWFRYTGAAWTMHGIAEFANAAARDLALTAPAAGWLSRLAGERFNRRSTGSGTTWKPYGTGMVPIIPTGVAGTGASIGSEGQVLVGSGGLSVSINGCFPTDFRTVFAKIKTTHSGNLLLSARLRASGIDAAGTNDYTQENFSKVGGTLTGGAQAIASFALGGVTSSDNRIKAWFDNPADAEATYLAGFNSASNGSAHAGAAIEGRHILTTVYDGLTLFLPSGTINSLKAEFFGVLDNN